MNYIIKIPKNPKIIIDKLIQNGYEAYIVGGCVRDSILGREPKDWDITTKATPKEIIELFDKVILTGIKHGTVTVIIDKENYEVTTYRSDGEYEDNRHPKNVKFVKTLKEDLSRRDFTINAMAYNENEGLIDYFNGVEDLKNKVIKTVGNARKRFDEDSLRIFRAIRFSAQLNFYIHKNVIEAIKETKDNIKNISKERIREEFNKILISNAKKIDILKECEIIDYIIPEISKAFNTNIYINNIYNDAILGVKLIEADLHLKLSVFLYNISKIIIDMIEKEYTFDFYKNCTNLEDIAKYILINLKYDNITIKKTTILIANYDCFLTDKILIKQVLNKIDENLFLDLIKIKKIKILLEEDENLNKQLLSIIDIEKNFNEILNNKECFRLKDLEISGNDLLLMGISKGKNIGIILEYLLSEVIKDANLNKKSILVSLAKEKIIKLIEE